MCGGCYTYTNGRVLIFVCDMVAREKVLRPWYYRGLTLPLIRWWYTSFHKSGFGVSDYSACLYFRTCLNRIARYEKKQRQKKQRSQSQLGEGVGLKWDVSSHLSVFSWRNCLYKVETQNECWTLSPLVSLKMGIQETTMSQTFCAFCRLKMHNPIQQMY